jgi:hypothetical protein
LDLAGGKLNWTLTLNILQPPRPPHWGGYRLKPDNWQFWQGRRSRLHDRLRYTLQDDLSWLRERLAPYVELVLLFNAIDSIAGHARICWASLFSALTLDFVDRRLEALRFVPLFK